MPVPLPLRGRFAAEPAPMLPLRPSSVLPLAFVGPSACLPCARCPPAGATFELTARQYVIQMSTSPPQCVLGLMSFDASGVGLNMWILGGECLQCSAVAVLQRRCCSCPPWLASLLLLLRPLMTRATSLSTLLH